MSGSAFSGATGAPLDIAAIFGARSHYAVLGVAPSADSREIRHAYRQVSLRVHPDKVQRFLKEGNPQLLKDAEAAFKLVSAAYELLTDDGRRAAYDQSIGLFKGQNARTAKQQQEKSEPWVYRAPKKEEAAPPEARENIELTVTHAVYGHEVKIVVGKGVDAALIKKTLSRMVKRGPPDRIELATAEGEPIDNDRALSSSQRVFSVGLSLGPPRRVKVAVTDIRTSVCRSIAVLDTSSMLQVAREVAKFAGVLASDVEIGRFVFNDEGFRDFGGLDERELLNGRRSLAARRRPAEAAGGLFFVSMEEARAMQEDLIVAYSREDVQQQLTALIARQAQGEPLGVTEFHKAFVEIIEDCRKDVITKWGFEGDIGFLRMAEGMHQFERVDEFKVRAVHIAKLLRGVSREKHYLYREGDASDGLRPAPGADAGEGSPQAEAGLDPTSGETEEALGGDIRIWRICGGQDKGGILAREGLDLESPFHADRLSTGAFVRELDLVYMEGAGERLHFQRLTGAGPETGWISTALPHKNLAERVWVTREEAERLARTKKHPGQSQPWRAGAGQ